MESYFENTQKSNTVRSVIAREILDSRGFPTLEVDIILRSGAFGRAAVPCGASRGKREVFEMRDNDESRYSGRGVLTAVDKVANHIGHTIIDRVFEYQKSFDMHLIAMDGSADKHNLGGNTILALSLAFAKAKANSMNMPLFKYLNPRGNYKVPVPMFNFINGGVHSDNYLDVQEFMVVPKERHIGEMLEIGHAVFYALKTLLKQKGYSVNVGDEGGFAPALRSTEEAIDYILEAASICKHDGDISIALDCAANEWQTMGYLPNFYEMKKSKKKYSTGELISYYKKLLSTYPIISLEDPLSENDTSGWQSLNQEIGEDIHVVGDDLFVTNPKIIKDYSKMHLANSVLIKMNQIGTVSEAQEAIALALKNSYTPIISHRSGETEDCSIAHLAVAHGTKYIKAGALSRTDRVAKYNELIRIEEQIKSST